MAKREKIGRKPDDLNSLVVWVKCRIRTIDEKSMSWVNHGDVPYTPKHIGDKLTEKGLKWAFVYLGSGSQEVWEIKNGVAYRKTSQ